MDDALRSRPQLLAFIPCVRSDLLREPQRYEIEHALIEYPVPAIPCTVPGFQILVEFGGGVGDYEVRVILYKPSGTPILHIKKAINFRPSFSHPMVLGTGSFPVVESGAYQLELRLNEEPVVDRQMNIIVHG